VPAAVARRWGPSRDRYLSAVRSWRGGGGPEEPGELAGDGDGGDVARLTPGAQAPVDAVQALLGAPGDLQDVIGLAGLAVLQGDPDPRLAGVVPGGLDQEPAGDPRAGLGDRAMAFALPDRLSEGVSPSQEPSRRGEPKRPQSPESSR
jgi:hypothetical protein